MGNSYTAVRADLSALKRLYGANDGALIARLQRPETDSYVRYLLEPEDIRMGVLSAVLAGERLDEVPLHHVKYALIALAHELGTPLGGVSAKELRYFSELSEAYPDVPVYDGLFCEEVVLEVWDVQWFVPFEDDGDGPWYGVVPRDECAELARTLSSILAQLPASDDLREHDLNTAVAALEETHEWCAEAAKAGEDLLLFLY